MERRYAYSILLRVSEEKKPKGKHESRYEDNIKADRKVRGNMLYVFFWVIPRDAGELPRRKHTTYRTRRKFEITREYLWRILIRKSGLSEQYNAALCSLPLDLTTGSIHPELDSAGSV